MWKWRWHRQRYGTGGLPCQPFPKTLKPIREGRVSQQRRKWGKTFPSSQRKWQHISPVWQKKQMKSILGQDKEIIQWFAWEMGANWSLNSPLCPPQIRWNSELKEKKMGGIWPQCTPQNVVFRTQEVQPLIGGYKSHLIIYFITFRPCLQVRNFLY